RARIPRGVDARGERIVEEGTAIGPPATSRLVSALADDGGGERNAHRVGTIARRRGNGSDGRTMAPIVAKAAISGNVTARRIDTADEFGKVWVEAAVDNADLDAHSGRPGIVGSNRIGRDRIVRRPILCRVVVRRRRRRRRSRRWSRRGSGSWSRC